MDYNVSLTIAYSYNSLSIIIGYFGFASDHNKPCLIYTTFSNKIYIYHNITLPTIAPTNLITFIQEQVCKEIEYKHLTSYN